MGEAGVKTLRLTMTLAALAAAVACAPTPEPEPPPPPPPPVAKPAPAPEPPKDQCGAAQMQYLVGKPKTEIPVPVDPSKRRVVCSTCPVTMDYRPDRLNIIFDSQTQIIKEVKCG
jgi:hypothetical protein